VAEKSAYHHGEVSLMGTIIGLAHNFIGSNNINLLQPIGQFGTRLAGGKDSASPRYIFTQMSPLARHVFNENDDNILTYLLDDNKMIEPEWYMPILPMVLVNGADGIGTGWMTKIPNYNPRDIVKNLKRMLDDKEPKEMIPWFKNFRGTIESLEHQRYVVNGEISNLSDTKVEVTELPVRTWTNSYKEMLEGMLQGTEKAPATITDYKDYNTDTTVKFVVHMSEEKIRAAERDKGLHSYFKLQTTISNTSMVLFDHLGCLRKYETVEEILKEFFDLRLKMYEKRKKYMVGCMESEAGQLSNRARFILEKCDGTIKIENKKKKLMIEELSRRGFHSDPIKAWKKTQAQSSEENLDGTVMEQSDDEDADDGDKDFDYLLGMPMWNLTQEKKDEICRKRDEKQKELKKLQATSKEDMWLADLDEFVAKLDEVEGKENKETKEGQETQQKGFKKVAGKKGQVKAETQPSAHGIRIEPRIADDLKEKAAKATAAKARKADKAEGKAAKKKVMHEVDEFDMMTDGKDMNTSLSKKLGNTPDAIMRNKSKAAKGSGKKKGKNPWSDSDGEDVDGSDLSDAMDDAPVIPREKAAGRRAAANIKFDKYKSDEESDGSDDEMFENSGIDEEPAKPKKKSEPTYDVSSDEDEPPKKAAPKKQAAITDSFKPKPKAKEVDSDSDEASGYVANGNGHSNGNGKKDSSKDEFDVSDSGSDFEGGFAKKVATKAKKAPAKKLGTSDDLFDSMMADEDKPAAPAKKPVNKRPGLYSDDDGSDSDASPKAKKAPAPKKKPAKKSVDSDEFDSDIDEPKPKKTAAAKPKAAPKPKAPKAEKKKPAPKKKAGSGSDSDAPKSKKAKPAKKKTFDSDDMSGSDFEVTDIGPAKDRPGRGRKAVNYGAMDDGSDESDF